MRKYLAKHMKIIFIGIIFSILSVLLNIFAQKLKGRVLDIALLGNLSILYKNLFYLFLAMIFNVLFTFSTAFVRVKIMQSSMKDLRYAFFKSILKRPLANFKSISEGDIIAKYTRQLGTIEQEFLAMGLLFVEYLITIIAITFSLIMISPALTIISLLALFTPMLTTKAFEQKLSETQKAYLLENQMHISKVTGLIRGIEAIKNYGIEQPIMKSYNKSNRKLKSSDDSKFITYSQSIGASFMASLGSQAIITIYAAYNVLNGQLSSGDFITVIALIGAIKVPIYWIARLYQAVISTKPARESIMEFISQPYELNLDKSPYNEKNYDIEYKNISFSYGDNQILKDLNLKFLENKNYLLTGESGCGKSTTTDILLGFLQKDSGFLKIGNQEIDKISNLSELITVSRQEATVFSGTVRENLTLFDEQYSDDELIKILNSVGLEKFANKKGLATQIEEFGVNLSGGEKKRIAIARAILRKSKILILDEPLANIDSDNIARIEDLILSIEDRTVIVISHHFNEKKLYKFDKIFQIKGGKAHVATLETV
ncbi:MAG: ABC transporter ATP-binding protein [Tissierellia bacterium]|nr:ABC transporter ATP-binding protein [Tissierellia bacterium]